jgi:hypothetical protein
LNEITVQTIKSLATYATGVVKDAGNAAQSALKGVLQNSNNAVGDSVDKLKKGLGNLLGK